MWRQATGTKYLRSASSDLKSKVAVGRQILGFGTGLRSIGRSFRATSITAVDSERNAETGIQDIQYIKETRKFSVEESVNMRTSLVSSAGSRIRVAREELH